MPTECGIVSQQRPEGEVGAHAGDSVYALLADGTTVEIRPARPGDFDAVRNMHEKMSPDNLYLRFFSMSRVAAEQAARRICREPASDHAALLAVLDGEVAGYGIYERFGAGSPSAEVALAVADDTHNRGVGTLLLEHLVSLADGQRVRTLIAETLSENALMLKVFADAGLAPQRALMDGVYELTFPLPVDEADAALGTYRDAVAERERSADVASLRHLLDPTSVAVIGAGRRPRSPGRAILRNITPAASPARSTRSTRAWKNWTASPACRRRPRCPSRSTWRSLPRQQLPCPELPKSAGGAGSRPWS
jgi:GNAT superfamily N-acetyltransferase